MAHKTPGTAAKRIRQEAAYQRLLSELAKPFNKSYASGPLAEVPQHQLTSLAALKTALSK